MYRIDEEKCMYCGGCIAVCSKDAIKLYASWIFIDENKCTECGKCKNICPVGAVK
ncbi:MAG: 4Fe-4S binding protein [Candidatus Thermoplasmatota archaeon]